MLHNHNELKEGKEDLNKFNCILCDTDLNSKQDLNTHYSKKHVYSSQCKDFLTDEDA